MAIDLYYTPGSAPCRIVLLVAAALDLKLNLNLINFENGEHLTPNFLKMNPQHTVPTILDGDFALFESRAISRYLVNKYSPDSSLYPKDPKTRALIDQRLDFDLGLLYQRFSDYYYPIVFGGAKANPGNLKKLENALEIFNTFLEGHKYAVGSELTLADLSLVATVSTIDAARISLSPYPNVQKIFTVVRLWNELPIFRRSYMHHVHRKTHSTTLPRWFELVKVTAPGYQEANQKGIDAFKQMIAMLYAKTEL